jgi:YHS domain-containing protein
MRQIIVFLILVFIIYTIKKSISSPPSRKRSDSKEGNNENMVKDPVCNLYIPESEAVRRIIRGKKIFFCSNDCAEKFESLQK